ncbi:MAG TPA: TIGR04076 family protein [Deltaproteobacteria bacterium]|nr:TIGR04076 family protein [Deltaproteobacteria bacterium]HPP80564.1 TIGR04076 family protein [Deltaproteobacteria bacterium]
MAKDPGIGYRVIAEVVSVKGFCSAGHEQGQRFEVSCHDPGGLCGFFYHDIFPSLQCFQFGGSMPWWAGDAIELSCPDADNLVTIRLVRSPRQNP